MSGSLITEIGTTALVVFAIMATVILCLVVALVVVIVCLLCIKRSVRVCDRCMYIANICTVHVTVISVTALSGLDTSFIIAYNI